MPTQVSYPGVYIEEVPSGVRTITGVATSITAFVGRALSGPVNTAFTINSFGDYERTFGGLWLESTMSYAVRDFFLNGGGKAIIVRILHSADPAASPPDPAAAAAEISLPTTGSPAGALRLQAVNEGAWGNSLSATAEYFQDPFQAPASPPVPTETFNLRIFMKNAEAKYVKLEEHLGVSFDENSTRYLPRVLAQRSSFVRVPKDGTTGEWILPDDVPTQTTGFTDATGGNDGGPVVPADYIGSPAEKTGIYALEKTDLFNLLCIPPPSRSAQTDSTVYTPALALCVEKRAMLIVDPPAEWGANELTAVSNPQSGLGDLGVSGTPARNAMLYYPRVLQADPKRDGQIDTFAPCGIVAGLIAKTDATRGVWKSPAGLDAGISGIRGLQFKLTDKQNGDLNPLGINCLRSFPVVGNVLWGARTMRGADVLADEWKYLAVRRTALFIEESLYRGTQWVVFEPNDEPLWAQIRLNLGAFMHNLFRQGAFQGTTPKEAYLVKCDKETTTQNDINLGIVNIVVGFAPLKPAEFVIIKIQQLAGQIDA